MNTEDLTGLVRYVVASLHKAGHLSGYEFEDSDIMQEGYLAALQAIASHKPDKGALSTHIVPRVRGAILDYVAKERNAGMASKRIQLNVVSLNTEVMDNQIEDYVVAEYEFGSTLLCTLSYDDSIFEHHPPCFRNPETRVYHEQIAKRIGILAEPFRSTVVRFFGLEGKSALRASEIAEEDGTSVTTVINRLNAALVTLENDCSV